MKLRLGSLLRLCCNELPEVQNSKVSVAEHSEDMEGAIKNLPAIAFWTDEFWKRERAHSWGESFAALAASSRREAAGLTVNLARDIRNKSKNRYTDILAYDQTRIVLEHPLDGNDYINANLLDGGMAPYIATQGPLPNTTPDFWQMVWEQNVHHIVMTTRELENGRTKCHKYWPAKGHPLSFNGLQVETIQEEQSQFGWDRTVILTDQAGAKREVFHTQYTTWPDHGVPSSPASFLAFMDHVRSKYTQAPRGPIVIHCSAGIGRSGTFVVVDICLHRFMESRGQEQISIEDVIKKLRKQRLGMVQMEEQYRFCYLSVLEAAQQRAQQFVSATESPKNGQGASTLPAAPADASVNEPHKGALSSSATAAQVQAPHAESPP
eukprot:Colp12_sorted_trinity150504_noHs@4060